jgi:prepilin-type N-terminal cleavage/methylation domain-containing protein
MSFRVYQCQGRSCCQPKAFTLVELMITVTIIAVVASVVVPMLNDDNHVRLVAAAGVITSDIELAQVMTLSYPKDPVIVRFDPANRRYWLAFASDPETPITRNDTGQPYLIVLGEGRAVTAEGVEFKISNIKDDALVFDAQGSLVDFNATPKIELNRGDLAITMMISASTGTITQTDGAIEASK